MSKEIFVVWDMDYEYEFFSTKDKAYARCVDIINEVMCDDAEGRAECLLELAEYDNVEDICGWYVSYIDPYDDEDETDDAELILSRDCVDEWERPRPMKYHIYNTKYGNEPLCADGKAVEFDNWEAAERFANSVIENTDFDMEDAYIMKDIFYYDGGYINATNLIINEEEKLEEVEENEL